MQTRNKFRRTIGWLLMLSGAAALGIFTSSYVSEKVYETRENRVFDQERAATVQGQPAIPEGGLVGRLSIPRLRMRAIVREGSNEKTLSVALGHIPGTAFPGASGNVGVAGHRDRLFRELKHVAVNDQITVETPSAVYNYEVESTRIVKPTDVQVLNASTHPELTLVTCYPFEYVGSAPDRFIVKARLVSSAIVTPSTQTASAAVVTEKVSVGKPESSSADKPVAEPRAHGQNFTVGEGHSRELVAGKVWFGLSSTDESQQRVNGWVWTMPDRRTFWLESVDLDQPFVFSNDGQLREITITGIKPDSVTGSLSTPSNE
jgi:LPXTG-site transpeptidase (sortase) family protein